MKRALFVSRRNSAFHSPRKLSGQGKIATPEIADIDGGATRQEVVTTRIPVMGSTGLIGWELAWLLVEEEAGCAPARQGARISDSI